MVEQKNKSTDNPIELYIWKATLEAETTISAFALSIILLFPSK